MRKSSFLIVLLVSGILFSQATKAQSRSAVDPGISTHNYKHPNKAAKAKAGQATIKVYSISTVEKSFRNPRRGYVSTTPKYAARPATLVIIKTQEKEAPVINPLLSNRNYKTQPTPASTKPTELANSMMTPDSIYPNRD